MELLITLADFGAYVPFSPNIDPLLVEPHVRDAQTFDVWPLLPVALRTELASPVASWPVKETKLFTDFVKPLLVCTAADRMLLWHGLHITPNGAETISDLGHQPISQAQRAQLRADLQAKAAHYQGQLETALRLAYPPTAGTCGGRPARRPGPGSSISAV